MSVEGYVFLDLETTGLEPEEHNDRIFELGIYLTDKDLLPLEKRSWLVHHPDHDDFMERAFMPSSLYEFVRNMHEKNGLLSDLGNVPVKERMTPTEVMTQAIEVLKKWGVDKKEPMCGSSIGLDRRFLRKWMPELDNLFSYRIIDVSSFYEFDRKRDAAIGTNHADNMLALVEDKLRERYDFTEHRVISDCHRSAQLLRALTLVGEAVEL